MKRIATLLLMCIGLGTSLSAQTNYVSGLHFGAQAAFYSSNLFYEHNYGSGDLYDYKFTPGFAGGVSAALSLNDIHEFQLEILYSVQGQNWSDQNLPDPTVFNKKISLQYLKLPLVYKYKMAIDPYDAESISHYFLVGVYSAFLQSASLKYDIDGVERTMEDAVADSPFTVGRPFNDKDLFISYDYGGIVGYGLEYPLTGNLSVSGEARAEVGFVDVNALGYRFPSAEKGYRSSVNVLVGLKLGLIYNLYL